MDLEAGALTIRELLSITRSWGVRPYALVLGPVDAPERTYTADGRFVPEPGVQDPEGSSLRSRP